MASGTSSSTLMPANSSAAYPSRASAAGLLSTMRPSEPTRSMASGNAAKIERKTLRSSKPESDSGGACSRRMAFSVLGDFGHEHVARAAHRLDQFRPLGVRLHLAAQAPDLHVDRAVEGPGVAAARLFEQEVAREDAAGVAHQHAQQVELAGGQDDLD